MLKGNAHLPQAAEARTSVATMTLTLPTPDAGNTARQRFALELLLQQRVPRPDQLLEEALPDVGPERWRALQTMPIAISAKQREIAIPSQWRDQD